MKVALMLVSMVLSAQAFSDELFVIKKSYNTKNVLHFTANVQNCQLKGISAHWIMGEERGQSQGLNIIEKKYFSPKVLTLNDKSAKFTLGALKQAGDKIPGGEVSVEIVNCKARAFAEINNREIQPIELFTQGSFSGLSWKSEYMVLTGKASDGSIVKFRFED